MDHQQHVGPPAGRQRASAVALATVVVALLLVGLVSGTVIRHLVQVAPVVAATLVILRRPSLGRFAAIPIFAFWLFIMVLIWLFLLDVARIVTGRFTPAEVVLTVVIGLACVVGLGASMRSSARSGAWAAAGAFLASGALQIGAMWLSMQPAIANR